MNRKTITIIILISSLLALGGSIKLLNAIDAFVMDDMSMPASVSLNVNDLNFSVNEAEFTKSQYCSKDNAFTFYLASEFPHAFTLRMVIDSDEPFKLNHRYEVPFENAGTSLVGLLEYNFDKEDDHATVSWIEFTSFEKEGGILTRDGEVRCSIAGKFGFTVSSTCNPDRKIEITEGVFKIPDAQYCDLRTLK